MSTASCGPLKDLHGGRRAVLRSFPRGRATALVGQPEVAAGKPPPNGTAERRSSAPTIRVAAAFTIARVVEPIKQAARYHPSEPSAARPFLSLLGHTEPAPGPPPEIPLGRPASAPEMHCQPTRAISSTAAGLPNGCGRTCGHTPNLTRSSTHMPHRRKSCACEAGTPNLNR